jgi:hypothetical protein
MIRFLGILVFGLCSFLSQAKTCYITGKTQSDLVKQGEALGWDIANRQKFYQGEMTKTFIGSLDTSNMDEYGLVDIKIRSDVDEAHKLFVVEIFLNSPYIRDLRNSFETGSTLIVAAKDCIQDVVLKKTKRQMRFIAEKMLEIAPPFVYKEFEF